MSDWNKNLAKEIAKGLIKTGIEGGYDSVANFNPRSLAGATVYSLLSAGRGL